MKLEAAGQLCRFQQSWTYAFLLSHGDCTNVRSLGVDINGMLLGLWVQAVLLAASNAA